MSALTANKIKKYKQGGSNPYSQKSKEERERLIREYAPLVKTIAGRLGLRLPSHINRDDLISAGIMGLLDAIDKFDADKGTEFKSYAEFRVRGAMLDELRAMDWVPRSVRRNAKRLQEAYAKVEHIKMRPAEDDEIAAEMGLDLEAFFHLLEEVRGVSIINKDELTHLLPEEDVNDRWTAYQNRSEKTPFGSLYLREVADTIAAAIEKLPENEKIVVSLYYYEELTMKEIGKAMGYTESRVSQLHTKAALRLRNHLKAYFEK
ncbi:MAG: FliA/WhiG family RNA polymerase sigma factor [Desulfobacteraceae bacterium]|nr:MAG: FliA/WhiG family RNA polymerase sigma factor [Desulfobacteraceae bacterium]